MQRLGSVVGRAQVTGWVIRAALVAAVLILLGVQLQWRFADDEPGCPPTRDGWQLVGTRTDGEFLCRYRSTDGREATFPPEIMPVRHQRVAVLLTNIGLRLFDVDLAQRRWNGVGVTNADVTRSASEIATFVLAAATVWLAWATRRLAVTSAAAVDEARHVEARRGIVELRRQLHSINDATVKLSTSAAMASPSSSRTPDVLSQNYAEAVKHVREVLPPLYPQVMAVIDDLPFVTDELRERASHALIDLMFIPESASPEDALARVKALADVRVELLNRIEQYQGRTRVWKPWADPLGREAAPEQGKGGPAQP